MSDLKTYSQETLDWLLEKSNPSVRYLTLVNILNKSDDADEVIEARKDLMEQGAVKKILSHQAPDGGFVSETMIKRYGELIARSGYQPNYRGTIWQALFLAQLGADKDDERIKKLCQFILDANYSEQYKVLGIYAQRQDGLVTIPCFTANMVWALSKFGFHDDQRVQDSLRWLLKYQRFDDGDFKTPQEWPYRGNRDRCLSKHSCYIGCTQALKAMTAIPEQDRSPEIKAFIKKGIDFVLLHRVYKKSRAYDEPIRKDYELLAFPLTYQDDILQILETLLFFNIRDRAIDATIEFILSKRTDSGRWRLEKTVSSSSSYAEFERKGKESKWITYRAINVLKKYHETLAR